MKKHIFLLICTVCVLFSCKTSKHVTENSQSTSLDSSTTYELHEVADTLIKIKADTSVAIIPFTALSDTVATVTVKSGSTQITIKRKGAQLEVQAITPEKVVPVKINRTVKGSTALKKENQTYAYEKEKETLQIPWWIWLIGILAALIALAVWLGRMYIKGWFKSIGL